MATNTKLAGDTGLKAWKDCLDFGRLDGTDPIKILDEELAAQTGEDAESTIAIMPTVKVNKRQYRGALEAPSVLRAICAGAHVLDCLRLLALCCAVEDSVTAEAVHVLQKHRR